MKTHHTPGPWQVRIRPYHEVDSLIIEGPHSELIADAGPTRTNENDANARLIAAAPELLAALEHLRGCISIHADAPRFNAKAFQVAAALDGARAAIEKATDH
jgi:hypothetical protein